MEGEIANLREKREQREKNKDELLVATQSKVGKNLQINYFLIMSSS